MWALWFVTHRLPSWVAWAHLLHSTCDLSSLTWDWTWVPCVGRQILNHWATREVPGLCLLYLSFILIILRGLPSTCHVWGKHGCGGSRDIAHDRALGTRKNRVQRSCLVLRRMSTVWLQETQPFIGIWDCPVIPGTLPWDLIKTSLSWTLFQVSLQKYCLVGGCYPWFLQHLHTVVWCSFESLLIQM